MKDLIPKKQSYEAMTLIEVLLYLALFGVIFFIILQFYFMTVESQVRTSEQVEIEKSLMLVSEHVQDSFDTFSAVDNLESSWDTDNGILDLDDTTIDINYYISDGVLMVNRGGDVNAITPARLNVKRFRLERVLNNDDEIVGARITFEIASRKITTLSTTISLAEIFE